MSDDPAMNDLVGPGMRRVFVRNMVLLAAIGVNPDEQDVRQRVRVNVEMAVADAGDGPDRLGRVVDYGAVVEAVRRIAGGGHIRLVETMAERIAAAALLDERVHRVRVRVEKLDIFAEVEAVGVEVERQRTSRRA